MLIYLLKCIFLNEGNIDNEVGGLFLKIELEYICVKIGVLKYVLYGRNVNLGRIKIIFYNC